MRFGQTKTFVEMEYKAGSKRLDLVVVVGGYKIGIETKYDLTQSGHVQRLLGQVDVYSEFVDALFIVQYHPIEDKETIRQLIQKKSKSSIQIVIIAGGVAVV